MNYALVYNSILINFPFPGHCFLLDYSLGYTQAHLHLSFVFQDVAADGDHSALVFER